MKRVLLFSLLFTACASVKTQIPGISQSTIASEQELQEKFAFSNIDNLMTRLNRVAAPILEANKELCPKTRLDIGVTTHSLKSYSKYLKDAAERELGAQKDVSILHVRPGSTAHKAGLKRGDIILSSTQKPVSATGKRLQILLEESPNDLKVKRGEDIFSVSVEPVEICKYPVRLSPTSTINAYADGNKITMTAGMMNFVKNDDELALILGHELGHNTMGHIRKVVTNLIVTLGKTRYTRPFESEADYVGMYYMVRAGYNPDNVEDVWRRLALTNPKSVVRAKTHPAYPDRYLTLAATRDEINKKKASGEALIPNFKIGEDVP